MSAPAANDAEPRHGETAQPERPDVFISYSRLTATEWRRYLGDRPYRETCPDAA